MKTRLSVLGLMSDLHEESIPYDLHVLRRTVLEIEPDLLCLEITHQTWDQANFREAPSPVREALTPAAAASNIVIVPVASRPREHSDYNQRSGASGQIATALDYFHRAIQRRSSIRTIHSLPYNKFCQTICHLEEALWEPPARAAWTAENHAMLKQILDAARRDPGRRILAATQCHRKHWLDGRLVEYPDIELVNYWHL